MSQEKMIWVSLTPEEMQARIEADTLHDKASPEYKREFINRMIDLMAKHNQQLDDYYSQMTFARIVRLTWQLEDSWWEE